MAIGETNQSKLFWTAMTVCCMAAFAAFAIPMYVIRPFRAQGATELAVALAVKQWGPGVAVLAAAICSGGAFLVRRRAAVVLAFFSVLFAVLSRVNVYEALMFHPIGELRFIAASEAPVDKDDMVIAVTLKGEAHAYPIRTMGYHHIANDWVGGTPIAATY